MGCSVWQLGPTQNSLCTLPFPTTRTEADRKAFLHDLFTGWEISDLRNRFVGFSASVYVRIWQNGI
jgi:hypothetical protein